MKSEEYQAVSKQQGKVLATNFILILFIAGLIITMIVVLVKLKGEETQCIADPYKYIIEQIEDNNPVYNVMCACNLPFKDTTMTFMFDRYNKSVVNNR